MLRSLRRPSPAAVVACLALAVSLSGVGYAAGVLPKASVGTPQLQDDAVTSRKVKDQSLLAVDFRPGQLPGGPEGPKGDPGPPGPPGLSGHEIVVIENKVTAAYLNAATATCPAGKKVLGGGGQIVSGTTSASDGPFLWRSFPTTTGDGWTVAQARSSRGTWTLRAYAVCASVS